MRGRETEGELGVGLLDTPGDSRRRGVHEKCGGFVDPGWKFVEIKSDWVKV